MVENKRYESAVRYLEDGLAETPDNPVLLENLGIAYLDCVGSINGASCLTKAEEAIRKAIDKGGRGTFVVDRSLEKGGIFIAPNVLNVKRGWLHITKDALSFQPEHPDARNSVIEMPKADIKEYGLNSVQGKNTNVFHIRSAKDTYNFRTANFSADEATMLFRLIEDYLGVVSRKK